MTDIMEDVLSPEQRNEKTELDVLKELFKKKNIETKTELTIKQVILINQKRMVADLLGWESLDYALSDFMLLMVSHRRAGRSEFIDGFKSEHDKKMGQTPGMFQNLMSKIRV